MDTARKLAGATAYLSPLSAAPWQDYLDASESPAILWFVMVTSSPGDHCVPIVDKDNATLSTARGDRRHHAANAGFDIQRRSVPAHNGTSIGGQQPEQLCRRGLVLVPEGRHIFRTLTVQENLAIAAMIRKNRQGVAADHVLETFPILRARLKGVAGHLSGGEQQQLAIARAILQRPALMMIDEPSLGLAPLVIGQVYESLRALNKGGLTLLVVEQSTARVLDLASRVYVFRNGHVVLHGEAGELADGSALEDAYFGYAEHAAPAA
ncbi:ABC transporter ATP-binding protein [Mesorhizobium sp. AR07]|uniref:ABC transporter ATP-binding protein n=1 Tax=Mesorhizobium sp. AR07 TaxID=2865838 RepID=UPI00215E04FE|nr:ATP-binding cassette domain-containing protein [Mesorhizobium sp. AR07]